MRHGPLQHLGALGSIQICQYPLYAGTHSPLSGHQKHRRRLRRHLYWTFTAISVAASGARNVYRWKLELLAPQSAIRSRAGFRVTKPIRQCFSGFTYVTFRIVDLHCLTNQLLYPPPSTIALLSGRQSLWDQ